MFKKIPKICLRHPSSSSTSIRTNRTSSIGLPRPSPSPRTYPYTNSPQSLNQPLFRVSGDAEYRPHVVEMSKYIVKELEALCVEVRTVDVGKQILDGQEIALPPVILASTANPDPAKKTILLYAHYDVQPVSHV